MKTIYEENYNDFPLDEFPYDKGHTALGEYHYLEIPGYKGNFYDPIALHQWRSKDGSWLITSDGKNRYIEQNRADEATGAFTNLYSMLVLKRTLYSPYEIETTIRPFMIDKPVGISFAYKTSRKYYAFFMKEDAITLTYRSEETFLDLAVAKFDFEIGKTYKVKIEVGTHTKVFLDNKLVLEAKIENIEGKVGFVAKSVVRYGTLKIIMTDENYDSQIEKENKENARLEEKRSKYSPLKCIKKINLKNFGTGRQLRVAKYNNKCYFLMAQHQKRIMRDSFAHMSCLTCFDIEGNILWQKGEPNNDFNHTMISCDLPFQVSDINNDGKLEVIYAVDFKVYICDLLSGDVLKEMPTPIIYKDPLVKNEPLYQLNVDAIRVADFEGLGYQGDFIIKDRYQNVWAYNKDMELMWRYNHKNTGHFPYIYDINNDGFDEMLVGYDLVSHDGKIIWSLPMNSDHTDEIIYTNLEPNGDKKFVLASGNEGMNIINSDGSIYKHNEIGHAQRISVADYDKDRYGNEIIATAFWGSPGIVCSYNYKGELLAEKEFITNGILVSPVSYDGKNILSLTNASLNEGGLMDINFDIVVPFPDDGHPNITCEVVDIDDDGIDEILVWNAYEMWIYKASNYELTTKKYMRYPENAYSNYRGEFIVEVENENRS